MNNISIICIFTLLFICIFIIFIFFIIIKKIKKNILNEFKSISEYLDRLAYGNLTSSFKLDKYKKTGFLKEIYKEIFTIKRKYNEITAEPLERVCYIGTDSYLEGKKCAHILADLCSREGEIVVIITVSLDISNLELRYKGFSTAIKEEFPEMNILEVFEAHGNQEKAYDFTKSIIKKNKNLKGIYVAGGSMGPPVAKGIFDSNRTGEIKLICHDIDKEIIKYIKSGVISAAILQDPIAQGYDSIIHMFNHLVSGWLPVQPRLLSFMDVVTIENCNEFWDSTLNKLKKTKEMQERKIVPVRESPTKIKIAVFGQDWNPFFLQIKTGSEEAINELKKYNADINWFPLNQAKRNVEDIKKDADSLVKKIINEKYHGIVTIIGLKDIVEYFNKAVKSGIPVVTFNSETIGLLSMLVWLNRTSKELTNMSDELSEGSKQINYAMEQISETTQNMVDAIINLTDSAKNGVTSTEYLTNMIEKVVKGEQKQMDTVIQSSETSNKISSLIKNFHDHVNEMKEVQKEVSFSANKIREMNNYSKKIKSILELIEYIAAETNLLSINASIEATKASSYGKGFKVVANEIKKLANETEKATNDVSDLIKNIQKAIEESNKTMDKSTGEVDKQVNSIINATIDMEGLSYKLIEIMETVKHVAEENIESINQMKKSSNDMSDIINKTSDISQSNSVAIEELNATTNEISGQMNEIDKQVHLLSNIILVLQGTIAQFTFEKEK